MAIQPGDRGVDYSYGRPTMTAIKRWGGEFAVRYSAGAATDPGNPSHDLNDGKLITPHEFKTLIDAGLDVVAVDEWYEGRCLEGPAAGRVDAHEAKELWRSCGYHKGASIYVGADLFVGPARYRDLGEYLTAYQKELGDYYHVDLYGGTPVIREMLRRKLIRYGWRASAPYWSNPDGGTAGDDLPYQPGMARPGQRANMVKLGLEHTPAHVWQTGNWVLNFKADENLVLRVPFGSHRQQMRVVPTPPPPKPALRTYKVRSGDTLTKIAARFKVDWHKIYRLNKAVIGPDPDEIKPGMVLRIPEN